MGARCTAPRGPLALIAAARDAGCDRVVVTHAQLDVVGMGAKIELCAFGMLAGSEAHLAWGARSPAPS